MKNEDYGSYIMRLFPSPYPGKLRVNGTHVYSITFQVTEACNLRCTYCYQHDKSPARMSFETAKKFIDMLLAADERTNQYITSTKTQGVILDFIGGEPLLEVELIDQIIDYFMEQAILLHHPWATRFRCSMSSNGTLYFNDDVQKFIQKHKSHLSIGISVDGTKELHDMCRLDEFGNGTYDRAIAAAKAVSAETGALLNTKATLSPANISRCYDSIVSMIDEGYKEIHMNCVFEEGWTPQDAKILYDQLILASDYILDNDLEDEVYISILDDACGRPYPDMDRTWCGGNGLMLCCDPRGDLYPCLRYTPSSIGTKQPLYKIGTVDEGIMTRPEWKQRVDCMTCVTRTAQCANAKPECLECPIGMGCADCAGYNYEVHGRPDSRATFICDMHKARVLAANYRHNREVKKKNLDCYEPLHIPKDWAVPIIGEDEWNKLVRISEGKV